MLKFAHYTQIEYIGYFIQYTYTRQVFVPQTTQKLCLLWKANYCYGTKYNAQLHIYQTDMLTEKVVFATVKNRIGIL